MAETTTVLLDAESGAFVGREIAAGHYKTADEVVRAGLRLLEEHEAKVEALRAALIAGEQSGSCEPFDFEAFFARKRQLTACVKPATA